MSFTPITLVCFAMKEEAGHFQRNSKGKTHVKTIVTGIGQRNAERSIRDALERDKPNLVLTCGFAGGLRPGLTTGEVLFSANGYPNLEKKFQAAGALSGQFYCDNKIAVTSEAKRALWKQTGADAVEMESGFICAICRQQGIPVATVRVILDTAEEDLPLDFNELTNEDQEMDYWKLTKKLIKSPAKITALLRLQKRCQIAAGKLSDTLLQVV